MWNLTRINKKLWLTEAGKDPVCLTEKEAEDFTFDRFEQVVCRQKNTTYGDSSKVVVSVCELLVSPTYNHCIDYETRTIYVPWVYATDVKVPNDWRIVQVILTTSLPRIYGDMVELDTFRYNLLFHYRTPISPTLQIVIGGVPLRQIFSD